MNKTLIGVLIVSLVIILGFGVYQLTKNSEVTPANNLPVAAGTGGEIGFTTLPATTPAQ